MVHLRADKVAGIANDIPPVEVDGDATTPRCSCSAGAARGAPISERGAPRAAPRARRWRTPTSCTSTRSRRTSARCCARYPKVLVPEMNLGQLVAAGAGRVPGRRQSRSPRCRACPFTRRRDRGQASWRCSMTDTTMTTADVPPHDAQGLVQSDQEVRWCPGCGDYSILAAVQLLMPELGVQPREHGVRVRHRLRGALPVLHEHLRHARIHGRAPAIATGVALARPDLDVWVVTRRRRHAVDRRQPPHPRAAPQRQPHDPDVQQPDLRAHQGPVLAHERGRQGHEVVAVRLARPPVQPDLAWRSAPRPRSWPAPTTWTAST